MSRHDPDSRHERRNARRRSSPRSLRMTAMIDICFLLLVYFVTTTSCTQGEGVITASMPEDDGPATEQAAPPHQPITVTLTPRGDTGCRISVNDGAASPRTFGELHVLLAQWNGTTHTADNPVVIRSQGTTRWQHVVNAFNAAVKARYTNVAFAKAAP